MEQFGKIAAAVSRRSCYDGAMKCLHSCLVLALVGTFAGSCNLVPADSSDAAIDADEDSHAAEATAPSDAIDADDTNAIVEDAAVEDAGAEAVDAAPKCPVAPAGMIPRAVWASQVATFIDPTTKAAFFDFAASHAVTTVYLQVGTKYMPADAADTSPLGQFIAEADARCIGVELLVGEARWTLNQYHPIVVDLATTAKRFTLALTGAKPKAFHVDIEPQGVRDIVSDGVTYNFANNGVGGTTNQRPAMMNQLLDVFAKIKDALGTTLPLHADIAFWFDGSVGINPLQRVSGGVAVGSPRLAHEFVIDAVDRVHLMAYRDRAFGPTCAIPSCSSEGIYDLSRTEVAYAGKVGKTAIVGVETADSGPTTSFFEENVAAMDTELGKVVSAYAAEPGMGGIAVHHLVAYRALQAKTP